MLTEARVDGESGQLAGSDMEIHGDKDIKIGAVREGAIHANLVDEGGSRINRLRVRRQGAAVAFQCRVLTEDLLVAAFQGQISHGRHTVFFQHAPRTAGNHRFSSDAQARKRAAQTEEACVLQFDAGGVQVANFGTRRKRFRESSFLALCSVVQRQVQRALASGSKKPGKWESTLRMSKTRSASIAPTFSI